MVKIHSHAYLIGIVALGAIFFSAALYSLSGQSATPGQATLQAAVKPVVTVRPGSDGLSDVAFRDSQPQSSQPTGNTVDTATRARQFTETALLSTALDPSTPAHVQR